MPDKPLNCLIVYPRFNFRSFWNYQAVCHLVGARYPQAPLGLVTMAGMLPDNWNLKLVDCNVAEVRDEQIKWADIIFSGGMIAQQAGHLKLIERVCAHNKTHVVGGPDATTSPHLYHRANHLVLGEAEVTVPEFLLDFAEKNTRHVYEAGNRQADITKSPMPRWDLFKFRNYLHMGVQWGRGCPFNCEFCDIIELFGRTQRLKSCDQVIAELQYLYDIGYRGHVDMVDDNLNGNRIALKKLLRRLNQWQKEHNWPFEFSTQVTINIADDEQLLDLMQGAGFSLIFVGIENPHEDTLRATQKKQNVRTSLTESIHKIYRHGMMVNTGYILGFDAERNDVADAILQTISESFTTINMVGFLFALPKTQLTRRLAAEGRLTADFDILTQDVGDQCTSGCNFETVRPKEDILRDYRRILKESYAPENYFDRAINLTLMMDCSKKRTKVPLDQQIQQWIGFIRLIYSLGIKAPYRRYFWRNLSTILRKNPKATRFCVVLMAMYLHFGPFSEYLVGRPS